MPFRYTTKAYDQLKAKIWYVTVSSYLQLMRPVHQTSSRLRKIKEKKQGCTKVIGNEKLYNMFTAINQTKQITNINVIQ